MNMAEQMSDVEREIVIALWRRPASWDTCASLSDLTMRTAAEVETAVEQLTSDGLVTLFQTGRGVVVALANTRAAREQAICLTKEPGDPETAFDCRHHWLLEVPDGDLTRGVCKLCLSERYFPSTAPRYHPSRSVAAKP